MRSNYLSLSSYFLLLAAGLTGIPAAGKQPSTRMHEPITCEERRPDGKCLKCANGAEPNGQRVFKAEDTWVGGCKPRKGSPSNASVARGGAGNSSATGGSSSTAAVAGRTAMSAVAGAPTATCPLNMRLITSTAIASYRFSPAGQSKGSSGESAHAFCFDATEVTVADYSTCFALGKCPQPHITSRFCNWPTTGTVQTARAKHPMNCVNWSEADQYCRVHGKKLPSEEEWLRGASVFEWFFYASTFRTNVCVGRKDTSVADSGGTCPVASLDAALVGGSEGNVSEWVQNENAGQRAYCGKSWRDPGLIQDGQNACSYFWETARTDYIGFRCVADPTYSGAPR